MASSTICELEFTDAVGMTMRKCLLNGTNNLCRYILDIDDAVDVNSNNYVLIFTFKKRF